MYACGCEGRKRAQLIAAANKGKNGAVITSRRQYRHRPRAKVKNKLLSSFRPSSPLFLLPLLSTRTAVMTSKFPQWPIFLFQLFFFFLGSSSSSSSGKSIPFQICLLGPHPTNSPTKLVMNYANSIRKLFERLNNFLSKILATHQSEIPRKPHRKADRILAAAVAPLAAHSPAHPMVICIMRFPFGADIEANCFVSAQTAVPSTDKILEKLIQLKLIQ